MVEIFPAVTPADFAQAGQLIREYQHWLGVDLCFQGFADELASLAAMYGPPSGLMLLARSAGQVVGCVGLRPLDAAVGIGEMKRMFVQPAYQGQGIGGELLAAFIDHARRAGYQAVRLDTLRRLSAAVKLYQQAGFVEIAPYRFNPEPEVLYLQLDL